MKNVYDIKKEKNLNFVLSDKYRNNEHNAISKKQMAIFIHLHYADTVEKYFKYLEVIPENIDVYITVSSQETQAEIKRCIEKAGCRRMMLIQKQNRGRDITALLVACRKIILEYTYAAFVHDKRERCRTLKRDIELWTEGLWENTLGSGAYICNIKELFDAAPDIGVLVPPDPMSDFVGIFYQNFWSDNFENTRELAKELDLKCDLDKEKPPITLGTVFWCRVSALKKLFLREWKYDDFPEEPLDGDGTRNHAVERIFAYVAQDAGFDTGTVMTDSFAGRRNEYVQTVLERAFIRLKRSAGIANISELFMFEDQKARLLSFCQKYQRIYVYGTGRIAFRCFSMLREEQKIPDAFLVSDDQEKVQKFYGIPVHVLSEMDMGTKAGVIVATGARAKEEILHNLKKIPSVSADIFDFQSGMSIEL